MILERDVELSVLHRLVDDLDTTGGRVVLVRGEAGIGKSALITQFLYESESQAHTLLGACDDLLTPQPLGPIWDIARQDTSVTAPLESGNVRAVMEKTLDLLSRSLRPTILVLEDTQWADEATLDLIRFLGRRIRRANGLLILTYRDSPVDAEHPLRHVIGDLPARNLFHVPLGRLSAASVASMISDKPFDLEEILELTGGNPLFVTEIVASGTTTVPTSVQDSVLARASNVSTAARAVLDLLSVVPGGTDRSLLDEMLHPTDNQLSEGAKQGLLNFGDDSASFCHELQRRAIESSLSSAHRRDLNQRVVDTLGEGADPSRLVHHAREAGDINTILRAAPRAAKAAVDIESTREAGEHFRTLEPYLDRLSQTEQAAIVNDWANVEFYLDNPGSVALFDSAIQLRRSVGDKRELARTLVDAARVNRSYARNTHMIAYISEAVEILEPYGPTADLARSLSYRAFFRWIDSDDDAAVLELVNHAMAVAETVGDDTSMMHALSTKGNLIFSHGDPAGMSLMEESRFRAERVGDHWGEVVALINMAGMSGDARDIERAIDFARRARQAAQSYEIRTEDLHAFSMLSEFLLWKGDWADADNAATEVVGSNPGVETLAWRVHGTIQARRGSHQARSAIMHMWDLARLASGLTVLDPAAAGLAEYMWLSGDEDPALVSQLTAVLSEGVRQGVPWPSGAFAFWMWKLGLLDTVPDGTSDFYGWIIKGEYSRSAEFWNDRGIPYEEGLALMHGTETEQIQAVRIFEDLGAIATASRVRKELVENGISVPRGKGQATRDHAAGLTTRQAEVLDLLAESFTNTQIADRLFVSQRTVENHVSAILMKLDVPDREAAVEAGEAQGILTSH